MAAVTDIPGDFITSFDPTAFFTTPISESVPSDVLWMLLTGFILSFGLAFGLGANDVANSFATSVGAKVLTLRNACILASIFETLGAVLLGAKVSDTIRKGIFDVSLYEGNEELLMAGQVAALGGATIWLFGATFLKLPVSGTHSIVGAMLGFHLVCFQFEGVNWTQLCLIVASWLVSPLLSGLISSVVFMLYRQYVLNKDKPLEPGLKTLPICYAAVMFINCLSIFLDGPELIHFHKVPPWGAVIISVGSGILVAILVWVVFVPKVRSNLSHLNEKGSKDEYKAIPITDNFTPANGYKMENKNNNNDTSNKTSEPAEENHGPRKNDSANGGHYTKYPDPVSTDVSMEEDPESGCCQSMLCCSKKDKYKKVQVKKFSKSDSEAWQSVQDPPGVKELCGPLQILSAIFASFAHGGNDVSNAIGPLVALWVISQSGSVEQKQSTPVWILLYGGIGITVGLWVLGRRVIKTVGTKLTPMTPSSGFTIELGTATTVLIASNLGIPISTTHCKVGSIVAIGFVRSKSNVEWKLFRKILVAWIVTLPASAGASALLMYFFQVVAF